MCGGTDLVHCRNCESFKSHHTSRSGKTVFGWCIESDEMTHEYDTCDWSSSTNPRESEMEAYQARVVEEKAKLLSNLAKLSNFLISDRIDEIDNQERIYLEFQKSVMQLYSDILTKRIDYFLVGKKQLSGMGE